MYKQLAILVASLALPTLLAAGELTPPVMGPAEPGDNTPPANNNNTPRTVRVADQPTTTPLVVGPRNTASNTPSPTSNTPPKTTTGTALPLTTVKPDTGSPATPSETTKVNSVTPNFQVIDLAVGATQEIEISNQQPGNFQFTSANGVISVSIGKDGSLTLSGVKGGCELQLQANPVPLAGVMGEYQSLQIKGITKFVAKKVEDRIFVSLRLDPEEVTITYNDQTPANQTRAKENYSFRFLVIGSDPLIIPNGKTVTLRQTKSKLVVKSNDRYLPMTITFRQRGELILLTGGSLLPGPVSP
ncbi:MAG TPA: hypothetical protein VL860_04650 [Planctomycetota bacterium]|nr:hypothetical protein [Planctomycetota bacterium]